MFNWGNAIVVVIVAFMSFIVVLVVKMTNQKVDLVQEGYYRSDMEFEKMLVKKQQYDNAPTKVEIKQNQGNLELTFPIQAGKPVGNMVLYRPSSKSMDKNFRIKVDAQGRMVISTKEAASGWWKVKLDWSQGGKDFYMEKEIKI